MKHGISPDQVCKPQGSILQDDGGTASQVIPAESQAHGELLRGWLRQKEPVHLVCYSSSRKTQQGRTRGRPCFSLTLAPHSLSEGYIGPEGPELSLSSISWSPAKEGKTLMSSGDQGWTYLGLSFPSTNRTSGFR